jgi:toxin ParE1/3/4
MVMRRLEVRFRPDALRDLEDIYHHIYRLSLNPVIANGFVSRIRDRCHRIGDAPHGGVARDDLAPRLRLAAFERTAVIAYVVDDPFVRVTNIFYGGRDYEALYRGREDE